MQGSRRNDEKYVRDDSQNADTFNFNLCSVIIVTFKI